VAETRPVVWSERALEDVEIAYRYFLDRSSTYAAKFLTEVELAADSLNQFSERGRIVPELQLPSLRELMVENHRLVYRVEASQITIARLIHGRQDFKSSWKSRP